MRIRLSLRLLVGLLPLLTVASCSNEDATGPDPMGDDPNPTRPEAITVVIDTLRWQMAEIASAGPDTTYVLSAPPGTPIGVDLDGAVVEELQVGDRIIGGHKLRFGGFLHTVRDLRRDGDDLRVGVSPASLVEAFGDRFYQFGDPPVEVPELGIAPAAARGAGFKFERPAFKGLPPVLRNAKFLFSVNDWRFDVDPELVVGLHASVGYVYFALEGTMDSKLDFTTKIDVNLVEPDADTTVISTLPPVPWTLGPLAGTATFKLVLITGIEGTAGLSIRDSIRIRGTFRAGGAIQDFTTIVPDRHVSLDPRGWQVREPALKGKAEAKARLHLILDTRLYRSAMLRGGAGGYVRAAATVDRAKPECALIVAAGLDANAEIALTDPFFGAVLASAVWEWTPVLGLEWPIAKVNIAHCLSEVRVRANISGGGPDSLRAVIESAIDFPAQDTTFATGEDAVFYVLDGEYAVRLEGIPGNCSTEGGLQRMVSVEEDTLVEFDVECDASAPKTYGAITYLSDPLSLAKTGADRLDLRSDSTESNETIYMFRERIGQVADAEYVVDVTEVSPKIVQKDPPAPDTDEYEYIGWTPDALTPGAFYNSYFLHADNVDGTGTQRLKGAIKFGPERIVGLILAAPSLVATDVTFGHPEVIYPTVRLRGFTGPEDEVGPEPGPGNDYVILVAPDSLDFQFRFRGAPDQMRIITEPLP